MIFSKTYKKVMDGTKTVTRRPVVHPKTGKRYGPPTVGTTIAVQPGRGKSAVGRVKVVVVKKEPLSAITPSEVVREGFPELTPEGFRDMFAEMYGQKYGWNPEVYVIYFERIG